MIEDKRDTAIKNLDTSVMASVDFYHMEVIKLDTDDDDAIEGFRIYYNDEWELVKATYWQLNLIPNTTKQHFQDSTLSPEQLDKLIVWFDKNQIQEVKVARERTIHFEKDPNKGKMIDL